MRKQLFGKTRAAGLLVPLALGLLVGCGGGEKKGGDPSPETIKPAANAALDAKYDEAMKLEQQCDYQSAYQKLQEISGENPNYKDLATRLEGYRELVDAQITIEEGAEDPQSLKAAFHLEFATVLHRRGLYRDQARYQYETALDMFPENSDPKQMAAAHRGLGRLYLETGYMGEAIKHFEAATKADAKDADAHYNLALLHRTSDAEGADPSKALDHVQCAVECSSGDALEMNRLYAELLMDAGRKDEAQKVAEKIAGSSGANESDAKRVERFKNGGTQESTAPAAPAPAEGEAAPAEAAPAPAEGEAAPAEAAPAPAEGEAAPAEAAPAPAEGEAAPAEAAPAPAEGEAAPAEAAPAPAEGEAAPAEAAPAEGEAAPAEAAPAPAEGEAAPADPAPAEAAPAEEAPAPAEPKPEEPK